MGTDPTLALLAEVRALRDQRDKVLAIHVGKVDKVAERLGFEGVAPMCGCCAEDWPCATVAALTGKDTER